MTYNQDDMLGIEDENSNRNLFAEEPTRERELSRFRAVKLGR